MRCLLLVSLLAVAACQPEPSPESPLELPSWHRLETGTDVRFQAVSAVSRDIAWISGTRGSYARTTDGQTWEVGQVPGASSLEFRDVHALSAHLAFLLSAGEGPASRIYRTRDGGGTWEEVFRNDNPKGFFDCMSFWDSRRGLAFSDAPDSDFLLISTNDGGDTWTRIDPLVLEDAHPGEGAFASSGTCLVTGKEGHAWFGTGASGVNARVFHTPDYGASWEARVVGPIPSESPTGGIYTVAFMDLERGLVLGGDYSRPDSSFGHGAVTIDGGRTWDPAGDTGLGGSVFGATFVGSRPLVAVAVAPTGSVLTRDGGQSWHRLDAESYWAVGSSPEGAVWAVGPGGRVAALRFAGSPENAN